MNRSKIKKYAVIIPIHNCTKLYLSTVTIPSQYFIDRLYESFQEIVDDEEVMSSYKEYLSIIRKYCTDCGLYTSTLIASSIFYNKKDKNDAKALFEWNDIIKCLATITHSNQSTETIVTAVSEGSAVITVSTKDKKYNACLAVTVIDPNKKEFEPLKDFKTVNYYFGNSEGVLI